MGISNRFTYLFLLRFIAFLVGLPLSCRVGLRCGLGKLLLVGVVVKLTRKLCLLLEMSPDVRANAVT